MDNAEMLYKLSVASTLLQEIMEELRDPGDEQKVAQIAQQFPGNLIPAAPLYDAIPFKRPRAAQILLRMGFQRVKKDAGIFWVKPPETPAP